MKYYGVIGNRDHIKIKGEKRPYWEFLDEQPDGWLSSLTYHREDLPEGKPMIMDCGAWSYKHKDIPPVDAESVIPEYTRLVGPGSLLIAPDHMLIDGVDHAVRREWNREQAQRFLKTCPDDYLPMACIHGQTLEERLEHAEELIGYGYKHLSVGGVAARASQKKTVIEIVTELRKASPGIWLHVLGLSSPAYVREWRKLGIESCDGSSHFKQAFTGGAFFTEEDGKLTKHQAVRPGESADHLPVCNCIACSKLRDEGIDTRSYGSNENNMGRAAHNQNMLMRAQRPKIGLVACCGEKLDGTHQAKDLYQSQLFKKSVEYVKANCEDWYVLSAKYGVIHHSEMVPHYDMTLNDMPAEKRREWAGKVREALPRQAKYVVLAGNNYCGWMDGYDVERPMQGLGIGQQLKFLSGVKYDNGNQGLLF